MKGLALVPVLWLTACATVCTAGSEFEPPLCPAHLPAIEKIIISNTAQAQAGWSPAERNACKDFRPTEAEVRGFFTRAQETTPQAVHYTLPESPCYAEGSLIFRDGKGADWTLRQLSLGTIFLKDGTVKTLYCPDCEDISQ